MRGARPGDTLALEVEIESCDDEAVAYRGHADIGGERAIELVDCLGPMLPLADFDDPAAMRERFALLTGGGARAGPLPRRGPAARRARRRRRRRDIGEALARGARRGARSSTITFRGAPVFPATLMLDAQIGLALALARESAHMGRGHATSCRVRMTHVKVRSFTPPGSALRLRAQMRAPANDEATFMLTAQAEDKTGRRPRASTSGTQRERVRCRFSAARKRRVAITGVGSSRPSATTSRPPGRAARRAGAAARRSRSSTRAGFPTAHRRRGEGLSQHAGRPTASSAEVHQPLASLRAGGRRAGVASTPAFAPPRRTRTAGAARSARA